jgi:hypothetical protein
VGANVVSAARDQLWEHGKGARVTRRASDRVAGRSVTFIGL